MYADMNLCGRRLTSRWERLAFFVGELRLHTLLGIVNWTAAVFPHLVPASIFSYISPAVSMTGFNPQLTSACKVG